MPPRFWPMPFGTAGHKAPAAAPAHEAIDTRGPGAPRFDSLNPAPVPSVTEQTTRALEHQAVNRKP